MNPTPPLITSDSCASSCLINKNLSVAGDLLVAGNIKMTPSVPGALAFFNDNLNSVPYSSVNLVSGAVTISRINLTGYGDVALTSSGLVQATTLQASMLSSPGAFTANSFSTPKIGFYGTDPIVRQTLTVGLSTTDDVIVFLKNLGLSD